MKVTCIFGEPATGKTEAACSEYEDQECFVKALDKRSTFQLDGLQPAHKCIVLEDFNYKALPPSVLLNILNKKVKYCSINVKYGQAAVHPERLVITSNFPPWTWYPESEVDVEALLGRFDDIIHLGWEREPDGNLTVGAQAQRVCSMTRLTPPERAMTREYRASTRSVPVRDIMSLATTEESYSLRAREWTSRIQRVCQHDQVLGQLTPQQLLNRMSSSSATTQSTGQDEEEEEE